MNSIHLDDDLYAKAQRIAAARGYGSVDAFIADIVEEQSQAEGENLDHLFTPEVTAAIEDGKKDLEAGRSNTPEQMEQHFEHWREEWRRDHAS